MARDAPWVQFFAGVELNRALRDITKASARQGEENDEADEADDGNDKNAAFGAGGPAAEDWLACGVGGEKMALRHSSAVGDAPEEGLRPVPCGVEADRPPQRAGAPETEAKHHADQAGREHADRRFACILAVAEAEEEGQDHGGSPETERSAVARFKSPPVETNETPPRGGGGGGRGAGGSPETERSAVARFKSPPVETSETAREGVLEVAAAEVLLEQADQKEAEQPRGPVTKNIAAKEQATVDDEQTGLPQAQNEEGKTDHSPGESGEKVCNLTAAAKTIDGVGTALDLRHDPGDEEHDEQEKGLIDERRLEGYLRHVLRGIWIIWVDLVGDEVRRDKNGR